MRSVPLHLVQVAAPLLAAIIYLLVPGHSRTPLAGIPVGLSGAVILTALVVVIAYFATAARRTTGEPAARRTTTVCAAVIVAATIGKLALVWISPQPGWLARYYVNDRFAGAHERSTDFSGIDATRVDRAIDFDNDRFPAHFLNDQRFETPGGRSQLYVEQPLSIHWRGYIDALAPQRESIAISARGEAWLVVDGVERHRVGTDGRSSTSSIDVDLTAGRHSVEVYYVKPANVAGHISVRHVTNGGREPWDGRYVTAHAPPDRRVAIPAVVSWFLHGVVLVALLWSLRVIASTPTPEQCLYVGIIALFCVHGVIKGSERAGRVWDLTTTDDWFGFEVRARDILLNGPLMTMGAPLGMGEPFYYYPLYSYFAAGVHWLTGEDGSGIVFAQFLVLALTTIVVHRLAKTLFDGRAALVAAILFIVIAELAFARYYTVTLLADNIYVLAVALSVLVLTRYAQTDAVRTLVAAGALAGVSALIKPGMLAFVPLAAGLVAWRARRIKPTPSAIRHAAAYVAAALAVVALATVRNQIVAGRPVLISAGQAETFVHYSLPSEILARERWLERPPSTLMGSAATLARVFATHPVDYVRWNSRKVIFSLGFVNVFPGYRPHPELLLAMAGYLAALVLVPRARAPAAWPSHLFVASHLATMVLTLPWVYGYRLILPTFVIAPVFAGAAAVAVFDRWRGQEPFDSRPLAQGRPSRS